MGPNNKKRTREQYVKYRLHCLKDLQIAPPPEEVLKKMLDEEQMSEIAVDAIFLSCIRNAE